ELIDALHQGRTLGLAPVGAAWPLQQKLIEHLEQIWEQPDEGIWEVRGGRRPFTFSKVMAWGAPGPPGGGAGRFKVFGTREAMAESSRPHARDDLRAGIRQPAENLYTKLRQQRARRQSAAHPPCRLPAGRRSTDTRHCRGHRARAHGRRASAAVSNPIGYRRLGAGRRSISP